MPPRTVKRGAAAAGPKRALRASRGAAKGQNQQPEVVEGTPKTEERPVVDEKPQVEEKQLFENKPVTEERPGVEDEVGAKLDANGSASLKNFWKI